MRLLALVPLALLAACGTREPPRGSGALETTPTASAAPEAHVEKSRRAVIPAPNGAILVVDPLGCRVELVQQGESRWVHDFEKCGGLLDAVVALDSVTYVRDDQGVTSFDITGAVRFRAPVPSGSLPVALFPPTALADSRVAVAVAPGKITVFERDGKPAWSFSPTSEEVLVAPPAGMKTEGLTLFTSQAVYLLGATGEIRFRAARQGVAAGR
ncbi:MAG TPA: hypothetical protein VHE30_29005 [Polyangiaceae bacterium]|nr:hypothetical protein [Polyangiaceae bacterium]